MEKEWPLVSVITLVYNTGTYVLESLECVKKQNYPNLDHVIIDDCSTDNSADIVDQWIRTNNYKCRFVRHSVNQGVQKALSAAFGMSQGKYFVGISDDLWSDTKLMDEVTLLEDLGDSYGMIYGDTDMIDKDGKVLVPSMFTQYKGEGFIPPSGDIFREIVKDFYFFIQASMIRLDYFKQMQYAFDKEVISEDWDWQIWFSRNYKIHGVTKRHASYRWLETSIGRTNWTEEKMHNVCLSHLNMLLKYYGDPKNDKLDNQAVFNRVWRAYQELSPMSRFTRSEKRRTLWKIFRKTGQIRVLPVYFSVVILSKESMARRIVRL